MRNQKFRFGRGSIVLVAFLVMLAVIPSGCGTQDWQRDLIASLLGPAGFIPIILPGAGGAAGPAGPAGPAGADGADGAPGPDIIIARAVINEDETIENTDDISIIPNADIGIYHLSVDLTGDTLPAGTTEDDFEVFLTLKEGTDSELLQAFYRPVSLVGDTLLIDVLFSFGDGFRNHAFSVQVLLPAG